MNKSLPSDLPRSKSITISADTQKLDTVLDFVNAPLDALGVPEEEKTVLDIAVEEIYVNIALYAYEPGRGPVTLEWKDPDITLSAEERQIGGLGIYMVRKSMDNVFYEYRDGQNCFTMKKILFPSQPKNEKEDPDQ